MAMGHPASSSSMHRHSYTPCISRSALGTPGLHVEALRMPALPAGPARWGGARLCAGLLRRDQATAWLGRL